MGLPDGFRRRLRIQRAREGAAEVDEELAFHFEETVRHLRRRGMTEEDAWQEARRRFGDQEAYRRALVEIDESRRREGRRREYVETMTRNLAFAVRAIRRAPGFAAAIVVILALGIGANAVMFGVVDRLLLSPPQHVVDADAVRLIHVDRESFNGNRFTGPTVTYPDFQDLEGLDVFSSVAAYASAQTRTLGRGEEAQRVQVVAASPSLFSLVGVVPQLGRFYGEEDNRLGAAPVAVLSYEFWQRAYGRDPDVLGRQIDLGGGRYEVVGVAPAGFTGVRLAPVDIWVPIVRSQEIEAGGTGWLDGEFNRNWWWMSVAVRLAPGVDPDVAAERATAAHLGGRAALIEAERYDENARVVLASVIPARGPNPTAEAKVAAWLAGVSFIVLLIACFNVANLLLARATRWRRELAVRMALGVDRGRLLGQLLTESLVLAGLGALGAVAVAWWGSDLVHRILLPNVAFTDRGLTGRLTAFLAAATVMTALLAGFLPALQATRTEVADALRSGGRNATASGSKVRIGLLVAQATLSVVLLVGAGLFVQSLRGAQHTDLGFDPRGVAVIEPEWSDDLPTATRHQVLREVRDRLLEAPFVENAALTMSIPFHSSIGMGDPRIPGRDSIPSHVAGGPYVNKVSPEYFATMGLTILRGRGIEAADEVENAAPVAVISESMAQAIWPDEEAVGQCMIFRDTEAAEPICTTVVGVVENFRRQELLEPDPHYQYFLNQSHHAAQGPARALMVRTVGPVEERLDDLRREVQAVSPLIRFPVVTRFMSNIEPELRSWRLGASMFTVFGLLALVVAALGLYSVLAFDVAQRQSELGVRAALGAGTGRLVRMIMTRAVALVVVGIVLGSLVALAAGRYVAPLLYEVSPTSPTVYGVVAVSLLAVAALAGSLPAWRATRVDPRRALEAE